jgi:hypothetical protein
LLEYFFLKYLLNKAIKIERIEKPRNRYALLLLIPQSSKKLKIDITAITQ